MGGRGSRGGGSSGYVTLYHRTQSEDVAKAIAREGFKPTFKEGTNPEYAKYNSQYGFFTKSVKGQQGYGPHVVSVKVPKSAVEKDPWSGHIRVKVENLPKSGYKYFTDY